MCNDCDNALLIKSELEYHTHKDQGMREDLFCGKCEYCRGTVKNILCLCGVVLGSNHQEYSYLHKAHCHSFSYQHLSHAELNY